MQPIVLHGGLLRAEPIVPGVPGEVLSGMIERETGTMLVVRTMTETVSVPLDDVSARQVLPQSLMPAGLFESLSAGLMQLNHR